MKVKEDITHNVALSYRELLCKHLDDRDEVSPQASHDDRNTLVLHVELAGARTFGQGYFWFTFTKKAANSA